MGTTPAEGVAAGRPGPAERDTDTARASAAVTELRAWWQERGILESTLVVDHKGTIVNAPPVDASVTWSARVQDLPEMAAASGPMVVIGPELGRGGMGAVHVAQQVALGRDVAVKSPLVDAGAAGAKALLREAWISGQLEHPNVVPVYALYRSGDGPLLVMRRVEGGEWRLGPPERSALEGHLRTLVQVCHAVHFAHQRGIVHLDLKPSNVMIGSYGEIYVVDWGLAVCLRDDRPDFLPRARDVSEVLGTPAYMAPELATGDGAALDARTDVYLLGAILHEILTGRPPHTAGNLVMTLAQAFASEPPVWPASAPTELAAIAGRALARDPADRYPSAAAFREALEAYLVHADSLRLVDVAQERCARVARLAGAGDGDAQLDGVAAEAEFGFRQALHLWPDNAAARAGLQALIEHLVERDLAGGRWQLAERRLAGLPQARPELTARVDALRAASTNVSAELQQLRHDANLDLSADQRSAMAFVGALLWTAILVGLGQLDERGVLTATHGHMLAVTGGGTAIFAFMV